MIFRVMTRVTGLMIRVTRVTTRVTRVMVQLSGSYRICKFLISPVYHISVWVAVMLQRRKF